MTSKPLYQHYLRIMDRFIPEIDLTQLRYLQIKNLLVGLSDAQLPLLEPPLTTLEQTQYTTNL